MERIPFNSGTILSAAWAPPGLLELEFSSLAVYQYRGVPARIWLEFKSIPEKQNYYLQFIRGQYAYECTYRPPRLQGLKESAATPPAKSSSKKRNSYRRRTGTGKAVGDQPRGPDDPEKRSV
jgi:hypothetical protein